MKKYILPICLWLSLVVIIVLGIVLSESTFASNKDLATYGAIKEIYKDYTKTEVRTSRLAEDGMTGAKLEAVYDVYNKSELLGYAYIGSVQTHTKNPERMRILVAMDPKTEKLVTFKVLSYDANDYYGSKLKEFNIFKNSLSNTLVSEKNYLDEGTYTAVSGATSTTTGIVNVIKVARVQFYKDINKELPVLSLTAKLNGVTQNLSEGVFNNFTANLNVTTETLNNAKVNVVFTYDFETEKATYVSSDKTLDTAALDLVMSKITLSGVDYIKAHNSETNEFTVITNNSFGSVLTTVVKVDEAGVVQDYSVTANPSFTVNWGVTDSEFDSFISSVEGTNVANSSDLANVSTATVTTTALKAALVLVNDYLNGGNE